MQPTARRSIRAPGHGWRDVADESRLVFEWVVPESERASVLAELESEGAAITRSRDRYRPAADDPLDVTDSSFEPLIVIVGVMSAPALVRQLARAWGDVRTPRGWIIDLRGKKVRRVELPDVDRGTLIVVDDHGSTVHHPKSPNELSSLAQAALEKLS